MTHSAPNRRSTFDGQLRNLCPQVGSSVFVTDSSSSVTKRSAQRVRFHSGSQLTDRNEATANAGLHTEAFPPDQEGPSNSEQDTMESSDHDSHGVYLSCCYGSKEFGAALYDGRNWQILVQNDTLEGEDSLELLSAIVKQYDPSVVISHERQNQRFVGALKRFFEDASRNESIRFSDGEHARVQSHENGSSSDAFSDCQLYFLHGQDFLYENARQRIFYFLSQLERVSCPDDRHMDALQLGSKSASFASDETKARFFIDLNAVLMVRSLGALLKFLELKRQNVGPSACPVLLIRALPLERILILDKDCRDSLQVFVKEFHPSAFKAGGAFKEGVSLYALLNRCASRLGALQLKRWLSKPLADHSALSARLDVVQFFAHDSKADLCKVLRSSLKQVKDLRLVLNKVQLSTLNVSEWRTLYSTVCSLVAIGDYLKPKRPEEVDSLALLDALASQFPEEVRDLAVVLKQIINFQEMVAENRFTVLPGVDEALDKQKQLYESLPELLTSVARNEMETFGYLIDECSVIYLPMVGFLLRLTRDPNWGPDFVLPGLDVTFESGEQLYCKSAQMKELDVVIGDIKFDIFDKETSIMLSLQDTLLSQAPTLVSAVEAAASLDALISLAIVAREQSYRRPVLEGDATNSIDMRVARHPLLDLINPDYVANSMLSGGGSSISGEHDVVAKVKILTGPNASGKSVYLKQTGLLTYMAHAGSFVPAESARFGRLDAIYTRMHSADSVLGGTSTFACDVAQMANAAAEATGRSLVLIDEFGKGTMSEVGLSLLLAVLEHWLSKGEQGCPHILLSSHLHSIIPRLPKSALLHFQTMRVLREDQSLVFLYQVEDGVAGASYAEFAAMQANLPEPVIDRCVENFQTLKMGQPIAPNPDVPDPSRSVGLEKVGHICTLFSSLMCKKKSADFAAKIRDLLETISQIAG